MKINIHTQSPTIPDQINGTYPPTDEQLRADGFRIMPEVPLVADGCARISITAIEGDGVSGQWQVVDRANSEIDAESAQSRLIAFQSAGLHYKASQFRSLLQEFFGPGAEVKREITADYVTYYLMNATGLTGDQVRDGIFLKELFAELAAWNGGETWTLFEGPTKDVIP